MGKLDKLVALLLSGACERLRLAEACVVRGDLARKGKAIGEVSAIIGHLNGSLDHEAGGEIAGSLSALYDYVQTRLIDANLHNDAAALRESLDLLGEIIRRRPDLKVQASGGVATVADLTAAAALGCDGAIVGRALYENRFTLEEALAA